MIDYHVHTKLCKHAKGEIRDYVLVAIERKLVEIGFSDHIPLPDNFDIDHRMAIEEFEIYVNWYRSAVDEFEDRIKIRLGIEVEYIESKIDFIKEFVQKGNFDYVIGSIHFLDDWNIASHKEAQKWNGKDVNEIYEVYYRNVERFVRTGIFDVVGHFDIIKKFGHRSDKSFEELVREILKLIKEKDLCVEINTSGLRHSIGEVYPSIEILKIIKEYEIPLTIGSDAHNPEDVGKDLSVACELVRLYGNGRVSIFKKREREEVSLRLYR